MRMISIITSDIAIIIFEIIIIVILAFCIRVQSKKTKKLNEKALRKEEQTKQDRLQKVLANDKRRD